MKNNFPIHLETMAGEIYKSVIQLIYKRKVKKLISEYRADPVVQHNTKLLRGDALRGEIEKVLYGKVALTKKDLKVLEKKFGRLDTATKAYTADITSNSIDRMKTDLKNKKRYKFSIEQNLDSPEMLDIRQDFITKNIELCQALGNDYIAEIGQSAFNTFVEGGSVDDLSDHFQDITDVSESRAEFWGRDQLGTAYSTYTQEMHTKAGIERYIWRTAGDNHGRGLDAKDQTDHNQLNFKVFNWETGAVDVPNAFSNPEARHPGEDYNCILGDSLIIFDSNIIRCYRRRFTGELTLIVAESGKSIRCTPNHPILTISGWKSAKDIKLGDNIIQISDKLIDSLKKNVTNRIFTAEEIFNSFTLRFPVKRICGFTSQFHGDGTNEEVDIIYSYNSLMNKFNIKLVQFIKKFFFTISNKMWVWIIKSGHSSFMCSFKRFFMPFFCFMCGFCKIKFLLFGESFHSKKICLRSASWFNSMRDNSASNSTPLQSVFSGAGKFAHAFPVIVNKFDLINNFEIVRVTALDKFHYDGLLYNFETEDNIYYVNQLSSHNCRCTAEPTENEETDMEEFE